MTDRAVGYVQSRVYMDTIVTIQVSQPAQPRVAERVERAFGWFAEVERRCSRFDPDSELRWLCDRHGIPVAVSRLLYNAIDFALSVAAASDGAFDPAIGRELERRGFDRDYRTGRVTSTAIAASPATYRDVRLDEVAQTVTLERPLLLDLGAVAKGLAIDLAAAELSDLSDFSINAGGDVLVRGLNPEGQPWRVGVKDPRRPDELLTILWLSSGAVCTSGGYERPAPGGEGHHILVPGALASPRATAGVTVVAPGAMAADALSTAAFVIGGQPAIDFIEAQAADALLVTSDSQVLTTSGFSRYLS